MQFKIKFCSKCHKTKSKFTRSIVLNRIFYLSEHYNHNMGFLKKLKDTAEKGIEKGAELGTKGYDGAKDAAKKGYDKAKENKKEHH